MGMVEAKKKGRSVQGRLPALIRKLFSFGGDHTHDE
jgi:hypothetical protein